MEIWGTSNSDLTSNLIQQFVFSNLYEKKIYIFEEWFEALVPIYNYSIPFWTKVKTDCRPERYDIDVLLPNSCFKGAIFFWSLWSINLVTIWSRERAIFPGYSHLYFFSVRCSLFTVLLGSISRWWAVIITLPGTSLPVLLFIPKTRLYNFDSLKPNFYIVKLGLTGVYIILLILLKRKHRLWVPARTALSRRF